MNVQRAFLFWGVIFSLTGSVFSEFLTGMEAGAGYQSRNDVRIPGETGTGFSLKDIQGSGPVPVVRVWGEWRFADKHGLRLTAAPVRVEGTGTLDTDVFFVDKTFVKDTPVKASYQFDTYRFTYRYQFHKSEQWNWSWGGTVLVRDAEIALEQNGQRASKSNLGLVPLLHLSGLWRMTPRWRTLMELDGLAGGARTRRRWDGPVFLPSLRSLGIRRWLSHHRGRFGHGRRLHVRLVSCVHPFGPISLSLTCVMDILVINVYCGVHSLSHDGIGIFFPVIALRTEAFRNDAVRIPDRAFRE